MTYTLQIQDYTNSPATLATDKRNLKIAEIDAHHLSHPDQMCIFYCIHLIVIVKRFRVAVSLKLNSVQFISHSTGR